MEAGVRNRLLTLVGVIIIAALFVAPSIIPQHIPKWWFSKPISLGLDLSGGVHLVYEVETKEAVKSNLQGVGNTIRSDLRKDKIGVTKVRVSDDFRLELALLSDRSLEQAKVFIDENYRRQLTFVESRVDDGRSVLVYSIPPAQAAEIESRSVTQAVETLRTRVDQFGVSEPLIQTAGENRIVLQMPGVSDIESVKRVVGSVAKLEFRLTPLPGSTVGKVMLKSREGGQVAVEDEVLMSGDSIDTAQTAFPDGRFEVLLTMTPEGGRIFRKITTENVNRNMAIILDGTVFSSPVIREPIPNGSASISGSFTEKEARELSVILRSGALPAPLKVVEERTVGPSLGAESIKAGITAILAGFLFIVVFMFVYYKKCGIVANCILGLNLLLCVAALSAFGATLTLPGLAGLALTVGMAVDSNVLIFERIRDELNNGSSRDAAVIHGFQHALSAIIDSNLTTLITGGVLYFLGTGSIKGFAVTLAIGIVATVFCATFASRVLFDIFPLRGGKRGLSI